MKGKLFPLIVLLGLSPALSLSAEAPSPTCEIFNGVNISHWLSQVSSTTRDRRDNYFTEMDAIFIKEAGFDHIRLPVDEEELWDDNGRPIESAWDYLDEALTWAMRNGLNVVLDLHIIRSHHFNAGNRGDANTLWEDPGAQEAFFDLWDQIQDRVGHYPVGRLAYEFMNEAVAEDPEDWNRLIRGVYRRVREREPDRTVVIGSNRWQQVDTLKYLWVPANDPNVILSFHFYEPFLITHHQASWTPIADYDGPVQYPGYPIREADMPTAGSERMLEFLNNANRNFTLDYLDSRIAIAADFAREKGLLMYCGEFGCLPTVGRDIRMRWYRDITSILDRHNLARANWDYQGGFRIVNPNTKRIDWELVKILTGQANL